MRVSSFFFSSLSVALPFSFRRCFTEIFSMFCLFPERGVFFLRDVPLPQYDFSQVIKLLLSLRTFLADLICLRVLSFYPSSRAGVGLSTYLPRTDSLDPPEPWQGFLPPRDVVFFWSCFSSSSTDALSELFLTFLYDHRIPVRSSLQILGWVKPPQLFFLKSPAFHSLVETVLRRIFS